MTAEDSSSLLLFFVDVRSLFLPWEVQTHGFVDAVACASDANVWLCPQRRELAVLALQKIYCRGNFNKDGI